MSWLTSICVAILAGVLGLFCTGAVAMLFVKWFRISAFEGGSGYFVATMAFLGGLVALVSGLVAARLVAANAAPGFFKELGWAWGTVLSINAVAMLVGWFCADPAPEARLSLRERGQLVEPPPPDPAVVEAEKFAALKPDAPLEEWLLFLREDAPGERVQAVMKTVGQRPAELATLIRSRDFAVRDAALRAVVALPELTPAVAEAVLAGGREIAEGIRRFNAMKSDEPGLADTARELCNRFNGWKSVCWAVHQRFGLNVRPALQEIHDLAFDHAPDTAIGDIVIDTRAMLGALAPVEAKKP
jgi:hypothetical protein